jgi:hypothetical protein
LLAVTEDAALSFELLRHVRNVLLPNYYCYTMHGVKVDVGILLALVKQSLPDLVVSETRASLLWSRWAIALFCDSLPSFYCFSLWDVLFQHGPKMLFSFGLALLQKFSSLLLEDQDDVNVCVTIDQAMSSYKLDMDSLIEDGSALVLFLFFDSHIFIG